MRFSPWAMLLFSTGVWARWGEVSRTGRTVLFVSHNAAAVENLCTRASVLDSWSRGIDGTQIKRWSITRAPDLRKRGSLMMRNAPAVANSGSAESNCSTPKGNQCQRPRRSADGGAVVLPNEGRQAAPRLDLTFDQSRIHWVRRLHTQSTRFYRQQFSKRAHRGMLFCRIDSLPLAPGTYRLDYTVHEPRPRAASHTTQWCMRGN
jgi:hypothetical protein